MKPSQPRPYNAPPDAGGLGYLIFSGRKANAIDWPPASGGTTMENALSWLTGWQGTIQEKLHDVRTLLWEARTTNDAARIAKRESQIDALLQAQSELTRLIEEIF